MAGSSLVILAAGRARRYGGLKQLAPIGVHGEGVIDLIASDAFAAGFDHIVLVVNPETGPLIRAHVEEHWPKEHRVSFAMQDEPLGTVHATLAAEPYLDTSLPFGISNADDLYGRDAFERLGLHLTTKKTNCLIGFQLDRALVGDLPVSRGICSVVNGHLTDIVERRQVHTSADGFVSDDGLSPVFLNPESIASMNLWGFQPEVWPLLHRVFDSHDVDDETEMQLSVFVGRILHRHPMRFDVLLTSSRCVGVTHADDLPLVQMDVRLQVELGERPEYAFSSP
ncbi:MAG TPA: NTP transferase domain-containing protein [Acidimicrobiales bacterium]|nr:NTP transferase domain-containing protein [Acidimicrobiales bacterium]